MVLRIIYFCLVCLPTTHDIPNRRKIVKFVKPSRAHVIIIFVLNIPNQLKH